MEPTTLEAEKKVRQGVWGDTTTTLLPDAFELLEEDPEADSTPGRLDPQPTNEELVDKAKDSGESFVIRKSREFRQYREGKLDQELCSPLAHQAPQQAKAWRSSRWFLSRSLPQ